MVSTQNLNQSTIFVSLFYSMELIHQQLIKSVHMVLIVHLVKLKDLVMVFILHEMQDIQKVIHHKIITDAPKCFCVMFLLVCLYGSECVLRFLFSMCRRLCSGNGARSLSSRKTKQGQ